MGDLDAAADVLVPDELDAAGQIGWVWTSFGPSGAERAR